MAIHLLKLEHHAVESDHRYPDLLQVPFLLSDTPEQLWRELFLKHRALRWPETGRVELQGRRLTLPCPDLERLELYIEGLRADIESANYEYGAEMQRRNARRQPDLDGAATNRRKRDALLQRARVFLEAE